MHSAGEVRGLTGAFGHDLAGAMTGAAGFVHEALLYQGVDDLIVETTAIMDAARHRGDPVLVVLASDKLAGLRDAFGRDRSGVAFAAMEEVGRNPARLVWAWRRFYASHAGDGRRPVGIGEPVFAQRTRQEAVECHHQESLFNLAFDDRSSWRLVCPYDVAALDAVDIERARRTHPFVIQGRRSAPSDIYELDCGRPLADELPEPGSSPLEQSVSLEHLRTLRQLVGEHAARAGLAAQRVADLVVVASELATNSIRHGGGVGKLRMWAEDDALVVEVRDNGLIDDAFVGRHRPPVEQSNGRGLWLVNQLCDLVQLRSSTAGTVVRARVNLR